LTTGLGDYYFIESGSIVVNIVNIVDLWKIYCGIIYCKYYNKGIMIKIDILVNIYL